MRVLTARPVTPRTLEMRSRAEEAQEDREHDQGRDEEEPEGEVDLTAGLAGEQDHRGDRPGPGDERDRQREGRDVLDVVDADRRRRPSPASRGPRRSNDHLPGREQQEQPAGDPERRQRDAQQVEQLRAAETRRRRG